jgi:hypothetical protein
MVNVITNMLNFYDTLKLKRLNTVKNRLFHIYNSYKLSKLEIMNEKLEKGKSFKDIVRNIAEKDDWFSKDYVSSIYSNKEIIYDMNNVGHLQITKLPFYYTDARFTAHIISEKLSVLSIISCKINDNVLNCFIGVNFPKLSSIRLCNNPITNKSIEIINMWNIPVMRFLNLNKTLVNEMGIEIICYYETFKNIEFFHFIQDEGCNLQIEPINLLNLKHIQRFSCRSGHIKSLKNIKKSKRYVFIIQNDIVSNSLLDEYANFNPKLTLNYKVVNYAINDFKTR